MAMWPFRRRKRDEEYVGRHRPGSWAEVALPPAVEGTRVDTVLETAPETVTIAPRPAVAAAVPAEASQSAAVAAPEAMPAPPAPVAVPVAVPVQELVLAHVGASPRVRLGFTDGTSMELASDSGDSAALQRAAIRLLGEDS